MLSFPLRLQKILRYYVKSVKNDVLDGWRSAAMVGMHEQDDVIALHKYH